MVTIVVEFFKDDFELETQLEIFSQMKLTVLEIPLLFEMFTNQWRIQGGQYPPLQHLYFSVVVYYNLCYSFLLALRGI